MINIIVIVSFFLDGLLSIYQGVFRPTFTVVSLLIIYPLCNKKESNYFKLCLILGLAYDIFYTNTLMLNMLLFVLLGFVIHKMYQYLPLTFINTILINLAVLSLYHLLTFLLLCLIGYLPFDVDILSNNFLNILLTNTIFLLVISSLLSLINKRNKKLEYKLSNIK